MCPPFPAARSTPHHPCPLTEPRSLMTVAKHVCFVVRALRVQHAPRNPIASALAYSAFLPLANPHTPSRDVAGAVPMAA